VIQLEDFGIDLSIASQGAGGFWRTTKYIPWFGPTLKSIPVNWIKKVADDATKSFLHYLEQSEQDTRDAMAAISRENKVQKEDKEKDIFVDS
jgi:hypothetical protein